MAIFAKRRIILMKKAIAFIIILLANVMMLAHIFIPHHHHNQLPVAVLVDCHDHDNDKHEHHHHNQTDSNNESKHSTSQDNFEDCLLFKTVIRFCDDSQPIQTIVQLDYPGYFDCLPPSINDIEITDYGNQFYPKPFLQSYYTNFITQSLGLRAPPFC